MADTSVEVANQALVLIGANSISSFVGTATEQIAATHLYQPTVDAALTSHRWRFASGKKILSFLAADPIDEWDSAFQMPTDPKILLLDEPTEGLAPVIVDEIEKTLRIIKEQGITTILVEQNAVRALELADRSVILDTGSVVFDGSAKEVLSNAELRAEYLAI